LGNTSDLDPTSLEVDDEEHQITNQPCPCEHLNAEEVRCCDGCRYSMTSCWLRFTHPEKIITRS
jgi:hypothetical protein